MVKAEVFDIPAAATVAFIGKWHGATYRWLRTKRAHQQCTRGRRRRGVHPDTQARPGLPSVGAPLEEIIFAHELSPPGPYSAADTGDLASSERPQVSAMPSNLGLSTTKSRVPIWCAPDASGGGSRSPTPFGCSDALRTFTSA